MARQATETREILLDAAEELVMASGFAAATVEAILKGTGLTKGAFFHHFPSKSALGRALVERYARRDAELLERNLARAERCDADPLRQVLTFLALLEEEAAHAAVSSPGCLFASYCYEAQLFDEETHRVIERGLSLWRERLGDKLAAALESHPPRLRVDPYELADSFTAAVEGGYVLSRAYGDPKAVEREVRHYRNYVELLFDVVLADR